MNKLDLIKNIKLSEDFNSKVFEKIDLIMSNEIVRTRTGREYEEYNLGDYKYIRPQRIKIIQVVNY